MEVLHVVDFVFNEINSRDASLNLSGSKQRKSLCFVPSMSPFWVSMVDRDWSQGKKNYAVLTAHGQSLVYFTSYMISLVPKDLFFFKFIYL